MLKLASRLRLAIGAFALLGAIALAMPAGAQQPNPDRSVNPTASSVKEEQLLREMRIISGRGSIPDIKSYNIEQPAGRNWREFHEVWLPRVGGTAILGMLVVLVLFYLYRGMVRIEAGRSGRTLVRFNAFERFVHWMTATCFIALALSGINITFGKNLLLPMIGPETFASWSQWAKYAHNYLSFPFTLGVGAILLMWVAWNVPDKTDIEWLREGGGMVGSKHPPAGRFNAGQKLIYWIVVIGGFAVAASGYLLMFPFYDRPCLYRHDRHGRRVRGDVGWHRRHQLGEGAPQRLARGGDRQRPCQCSAAKPHGRSQIAPTGIDLRCAPPMSRTRPRPAPATDAG